VVPVHFYCKETNAVATVSGFETDELYQQKVPPAIAETDDRIHESLPVDCFLQHPERLRILIHHLATKVFGEYIQRVFGKYSLQILCSFVFRPMASHVFFDKDCFHVTNGNSSSRRSLAAGDDGGNGLQIIPVASLVFLVRVVLLIISPGTLMTGFVA
jgi:hypothetical protein